MRRHRLTAAAAVAAALAVLPTAASGASRDQIRDAVGDARADQKYVDIVTARWSSAGRGVDKALVATLTLAAPPKSEQSFSYELLADVRGCGRVWLQYHPATVADAVHTRDITGSVWTECGGPGTGPDASTLTYVDATVKGTTITWTVPLSVLPPQVQVGAVFSRFTAVADAGEPVLGTAVGGTLEQSLDYAVGDGTWRLR